MKKMMLMLALVLVCAAGYSQDVLGKWFTEAGDAQVEIYQSGDKLNGKIVWLSKGPETKDTHNPDKKLQSRKLMGVHILSDLAKGKDKWEGGKIYNPKNGKSYKCTMWLEGESLKVRGHIGPFFETQTWKRKK